MGFNYVRPWLETTFKELLKTGSVMCIAKYYFPQDTLCVVYRFVEKYSTSSTIIICLNASMFNA